MTEEQKEELRATIAKGDELCRIAKINNKHPQPANETEDLKHEAEVTV